METIEYTIVSGKTSNYYTLSIRLQPQNRNTKIEITAQANDEPNPEWYAWRAHIEVLNTSALSTASALVRRFLGKRGLCLDGIRSGLKRGRRVVYDSREYDYIPADQAHSADYARYCDKLPYPNTCVVARDPEEARRFMIMKYAQRGNTDKITYILDCEPVRDYNVSAPTVEPIDVVLEPWNR